MPAATMANPALLALVRRDAREEIRVNHEVLERILSILPEIQRRLPGANPPSADALHNPFVETSRESFRIALDVSAYSLVGLTRAVAPLMEKRGGGSILTLTFIGSDRVYPNYNVMGVAKAALEASVRYLASDLGPRGIRVNAICPGTIESPSLEERIQSLSQSTGRSLAEVERDFVERAKPVTAPAEFGANASAPLGPASKFNVVFEA